MRVPYPLRFVQRVGPLFASSYFLLPTVHCDQSIAAFVVQPTTPKPVPRMRDDPSFHGIHVHVIQFLAEFFFGIYIEVVISPLPEAFSIRQVSREGLAQCPRNPLLENLNNLPRRAAGWFVNEQMNVLRHYHVAYQPESSLRAHFAENLQKTGFCFIALKERPPLVTTECDEVDVSTSGLSSQSTRHREEGRCKTRKNFPPFAKTAKGRAPSQYNLSGMSRNGMHRSRIASHGFGQTQEARDPSLWRHAHHTVTVQISGQFLN
jgi:hypothetical protein